MTRLPVLLAQIKGGNNSYKLKNEIRQIYLFVSTQKNQKTLQQFNQVIIIIAVHTENKKLVITTAPKSFHLDLPRDIGINFKHELSFIINYSEHLAEHTTENEIRQILSKYKHGNDIHKHGKL